MAKKGKFKTVTETATGAMEIAFNELESLKDEMSEWRDNMEEKLSHTDRFERVSEAADTLENAHSDIEGVLDEITSALDTVGITVPEVSFPEFVPYKGHHLSRADRLGNASNAMNAGIKAVTTAIEGFEIPEGDDDTEEPVSEKIDDLRGQVEDVRGGWEETDSVEFPGMYG